WGLSRRVGTVPTPEGLSPRPRTRLAPFSTEEISMRTLVLTPPLLGFVVGPRAALAFGVGLLVADRIPEDRRHKLAVTLIALGAATTIPAAMSIFRGSQPATNEMRRHG